MSSATGTLARAEAHSPLLETHVLLGRGTGLVLLVHVHCSCPGCQAAPMNSGAHQAGLDHAAATTEPSS